MWKILASIESWLIIARPIWSNLLHLAKNSKVFFTTRIWETASILLLINFQYWQEASAYEIVFDQSVRKTKKWYRNCLQLSCPLGVPWPTFLESEHHTEHPILGKQVGWSPINPKPWTPVNPKPGCLFANALAPPSLGLVYYIQAGGLVCKL